MNLELRLSEWCDGKLGLQELKLHLASAQEALSEHRNGLENTLASLDDPEDFEPTFHVNYQSKLSWLAINDDLPKYDSTLLHAPEDLSAYHSD